MKVKNYIYISFFFLLCLFTTSSCNQQKDTKRVSGTTNSLTAAVNGKSYNAIHVTGFISTIPNTLLLTGAMGTGEDIQLFLPKEVTSGTYKFEDLLVQGKYQENEELSGFATRGTVTITTHDIGKKQIEGTFYFTTKPLVKGNPSFDITEGIFKIAY